MFAANRDIREFITLAVGLIVVCLVFTVVLLLFTTDENDFFYQIKPNQNERPFTLFYFSISTATTVGYGDISPKSMRSRLFCIIFKLFIFAGIISLLFNF